MIDVAEALAPEMPTKIIGIRPGEKLHEEMITVTDALNTVEFDRYFVILPAAPPDWDIQKFIQDSNSSPGELVSDQFSYNSGTNKKFLSTKELRLLIKTELDA